MPTISDIDKNFKIINASDTLGLRWYDAGASRMTVRGLAWFNPRAPRWCRLPPRAQRTVRADVWTLAQHLAGARICFKTDSSRIVVRVKRDPDVVMPHMPATGSHGMALYEGHGVSMRPRSVVVPDPVQTEYERELFRDQPRRLTEYTLYLPLYSGLKHLSIGLVPGSVIKPPTPPAVPKPAVFYGTSITQGGCASLPGSDHVATIGRRLDLDVINLGFSGNGLGEPEVAELIAEIDASLYALCYSENAGSKRLRLTLPRFIRILRHRHPHTPILLVGALAFWHKAYSKDAAAEYERSNDIMREECLRQRRAGDSRIQFVHGAAVLPPGIDAAFVDGVHPTDHGFQIMADHLTPVVRESLATG